MVTYAVTFTPRDLPGFLDMLRYEGATVLSWDHSQPGVSSTLGPSSRETYTVTLSGPRQPVYDRWRSFSLYPKVL